MFRNKISNLYTGSLAEDPGIYFSDLFRDPWVPMPEIQGKVIRAIAT
jgi:hypothetical protein